MGKRIYLTEKEIEWLKVKLCNLSGMGLYFEDDNEREIVDNVFEKVNGEPFA